MNKIDSLINLINSVENEELRESIKQALSDWIDEVKKNISL